MSVPKLVFLGMGGVGRTMLEMLPMSQIPKKYIRNIVIIEPKDLSSEDTIKDLRNLGFTITIECIEVNALNINMLLNKYVEHNDIVIDVSYNIAFQPILEHCFTISAMYINTSMEPFPAENEHILEKESYPRTLHYLHNVANNIESRFLKYNKSLPTVVVTHGMNPGLITHFVRLGLDKITKLILSLTKKYKVKSVQLSMLKSAYKKSNYALISYLLGLETIHCSERDTQVSTILRKSNEFMNTWGPYSFYAEGVDPIQIGLGTHENINKYITLNGKRYSFELPDAPGPKNQVYSHIRGIDVTFESYVPITNSSGKMISGRDGRINGMAIPHSENDTTNRYLSLYTVDKSYILCNTKDIPKAKLLYRPSNYYVYSPCKAAQDSINEVRKRNYKMLETQHALRGFEIKTGEDAVGALLIFGENPLQKMIVSNSSNFRSLSDRISEKLFGDIQVGSKSLWTGTILSIEETKQMSLYYSGPTTVQVGASLISAIHWMLKHKRRGLCYPEDIPYKKILKHASKWLGRIFCDFVPYNPKSTDLKYLSSL